MHFNGVAKHKESGRIPRNFEGFRMDTYRQPERLDQLHAIIMKAQSGGQ
jgi:hypothetical protein